MADNDTVSPILADDGDDIAALMGEVVRKSSRNLSTTMGHSTGLIREQCPVW